MIKQPTPEPPVSSAEACSFLTEHALYSLEDTRSSVQICEELRFLGSLSLSETQKNELSALNRTLQDQRTAFRFSHTPDKSTDVRDPLAY